MKKVNKPKVRILVIILRQSAVAYTFAQMNPDSKERIRNKIKRSFGNASRAVFRSVPVASKERRLFHQTVDMAASN